MTTTWNGSDKDAGITLSGGNLVATNSSGSWQNVRANISKTSGKWYWEVKRTGSASAARTGYAGSGALSNPFDNGSNGWGFGADGRGDCVTNGSITLIGSVDFALNTTAMFAMDVDAGKLWVGIGGTWLNSGVPASGTGAIWTITGGTQLFPVASCETANDAVTANFGATTTTYTAPTGFSTFDTPAAAVTFGNMDLMGCC